MVSDPLNGPAENLGVVTDNTGIRFGEPLEHEYGDTPSGERGEEDPPQGGSAASGRRALEPTPGLQPFRNCGGWVNENHPHFFGLAISPPQLPGLGLTEPSG